MKLIRIPLTFFYFLLLLSPDSFAQKLKQKKNIEVKPELNKHFEKHGYKGAFILYDLNEKKYTSYNPERCEMSFSPASTFKIFNSLVALETGVVTDSSFVIRWDSIQRFYPPWNQDQSLQSAFKYSAVWYYQEVARRIGQERMKKYIEQEGFGNMDISGDIDVFWLESSLKISPEQQMDFLIKLYNNKLRSFSQRSQKIVKDIMLDPDTSAYKLRSKTGSAGTDTNYQGWYVGWIEKADNVYFFVTHFEAPSADFQLHGKRRKEITMDILRELGVLE